MFARKWPLISSIALAAVLLTQFSISAQNTNTSSGEQQEGERKLIREDKEKRVYETDEVIIGDIKNPEPSKPGTHLERYKELKRRGEVPKDDEMILDKTTDEVPIKSPLPVEEPDREPVIFPGQLPKDFNPREYKNPIPDPSVKDRPGISHRSSKKKTNELLWRGRKRHPDCRPKT